MTLKDLKIQLGRESVSENWAQYAMDGQLRVQCTSESGRLDSPDERMRFATSLAA